MFLNLKLSNVRKNNGKLSRSVLTCSEKIETKLLHDQWFLWDLA